MRVRENASIFSHICANMWICALEKSGAWPSLIQSPFRNQGVQLSGMYVKQKMTGGTPEVRSDQSLSLLTFSI